ncbi:PepSY domain-containing protein [Thalassomonas viridans]|uniref:PepSY domain-containing protein n=2 Tax=Thalassomonas viridans TaxID=137584 RepID=A0AAF0CA19_9GAMM|nr:PepSY domain-containing protein [Thalassomonas viridans]
MLKVSRKTHKWLMLFIGIQFVIWSVSGAYMVIFDIHYIHGDSLVQQHRDIVDGRQIKFPLKQLLARYPSAEKLSLGSLVKEPVYRFIHDGEQHMVSAVNGELLSPITRAEAEAAARYYYSGSGAIAGVELIRDNPPSELSKRHLPVYRVNFDDFASPSLYISVSSGELVTKRHEFWRGFDLMFNLHVMDYQDGSSANKLLLVSSLLGLLAALTGLVLVCFKVLRRKAAGLDGNNQQLTAARVHLEKESL